MLCASKQTGYLMNYPGTKCTVKYIYILIDNLTGLNLNHLSSNFFLVFRMNFQTLPINSSISTYKALFIGIFEIYRLCPCSKFLFVFCFLKCDPN